MAVRTHELVSRSFETRLIEVLKCGLHNLGMDKLRIDAQYHAALKPISYSRPTESLIEFRDGIVTTLCYSQTLLMHGIELPRNAVDVHQAHLDNVESFVYIRLVIKVAQNIIGNIKGIAQGKFAVLSGQGVVNMLPPFIILD